MRGMPSRDYYVVLNVQPQASAAEIKISYRKLALKYHPDRNGGNSHTEALFKEINEAYSVLSNQQKREDYNRLRNTQATSAGTNTTAGAHSNQSQNKYRQPPPVTGKTILFQSTHLRNVVEKSNPFAINADGLFVKIESILSDAHLHILLNENKRIVNSQVLHEILISCRPLPENYFNAITLRLYRLAGNDAIMRNAIQQAIKQKKQDYFWQKYKFWWVLIVTLIICFLIYFM
jgi:curved DNA-binding protein CbpA